MSFDLKAWRQSLRQHLGGWWPRVRVAGTQSVYAGLSAAVLWPVVQAVQDGEVLPAMVALGGVAGGVGGNLIAEQLQRWKDRVDKPLQESEVAQWVEERVAADRDLRAALDSLIERLDAVVLATASARPDDRRELLDRLDDERRRFDGGVTMRARVHGLGAIAQGPGAVAVGAGGVAVGGNVSGSVHVGVRPGADAVKEDRAATSVASASASATRSRSPAGAVAVVYGRNEAARRGTFTFLASLGLSPIEFGQATARIARGAPYIGEILDRLFSEAQAVVVLFTGDEIVRLREAFRDATQPEDGHEAIQARPNVLFEAGLALGRKPDHTIVVQLGPHRPFSDIGGRHVIRFDGSSASRNEVASALEAAGCPVNRNGRDWLVAGQHEFDEALKHAALPPPDRLSS